MLAITVSATKSYLHAWKQCVRAIAAASSHHAEAHFIFATDESKEGKAAAEVARCELPEGWKVSVLTLPIKDDTTVRYKDEAQMRIAALQGACFSLARKTRATRCLVVESDTILPANALRVLEWTLDMPKADGSPFYHIAAATYPNGAFLGGFGTPQNQIAEDFLPSERKLPVRLKLCLDRCEERLKAIKKPTNESEHKAADKIGEKEHRRMGRLMQKIKNCPPDGNVWEVTAKYGWRRRGWMDAAYPSIGRGAVVPSDWCGLGCTLLSAIALAHSDFNGYEGKGTQDLFLCWNRWYPEGLKIACVPHIACDHIKQKPDGDLTDSPKILHHRAYHETDPAYAGHLRCRSQPFVPV